MRTVNYKFTQDEFHTLITNTAYSEVKRALGYLSTWNLLYPVVEVFISSNNYEIVAVYKQNSDDGVLNAKSYCIGAVWRDDDKAFSFHS